MLAVRSTKSVERFVSTGPAQPSPVQLCPPTSPTLPLNLQGVFFLRNIASLAKKNGVPKLITLWWTRRQEIQKWSGTMLDFLYWRQICFDRVWSRKKCTSSSSTVTTVAALNSDSANKLQQKHRRNYSALSIYLALGYFTVFVWRMARAQMWMSNQLLYT